MKVSGSGIGNNTINVSGTFSATEAKSSSAPPIQITSSAANQTALASNANRLGMMVQNSSTATLYIKYGATATLSDWNVKVGPNEFFNMPKPTYTGRIDCIWDAADGYAQFTELS